MARARVGDAQAEHAREQAAGSILRPHPGPQEDFLTTTADICILGGSAGGGKTYGLLLDPVRYMNVPGYGAVIFRRTYPDITNEGGLWDTSFEIYPHLGAKPRENRLDWTFPPHYNRVRFSHMQHEHDVERWKGAQVPAILFDQLEEFGERQFWYMFSRNRSMAGIKPYIRGTVNPDPDSFVVELLAPWISEGHPLFPMAPGQLAYFTKEGDNVEWVEADWRDENDRPPTSFTFLPATVWDNPSLLKADPGYLTRLRSLNVVDRARLLYGDWTVRVGGRMFKREWFKIEKYAPPKFDIMIRAWDDAGTEATDARGKAPDPDYTVGVLAGLAGGHWYVLDVVRERLTPNGVVELRAQTAKLDGRGVSIALQQDPGSAGKRVVLQDAGDLSAAGYHVIFDRPTGDKIVRAKPLSSAAEAGRIHLVQQWHRDTDAEWIRPFLNEAVVFPSKVVHDDQIDALSWLMLMAAQAGVPAGGVMDPRAQATPKQIGLGSRTVSGLHAARRRSRI